MKTGIFKTAMIKGAFLTTVFFASHAALAESKPPTSANNDSTHNTSELNEIKVKGFDRAQGLKQLDLDQFDGFLVQEATLEFDSYWLREHKFHMSDNDEKRLREDYTRVLKEALEKTVEKDTALSIKSVATGNTLVIEPSLTRFRLNAPDLSFKGRTKDYVHAVGAARVTMTLKKGEQVLSTLSDYDETRSDLNRMKPTNRATNLWDFKQLSKRWATKLSRYLNS